MLHSLPAPVTLRSHGKINLGLEVLNKRADGYHNISSVFIGISLYDTIQVEHSTKLLVECIPSVTTNIYDNLVYKAAQAYHNKFVVQEGDANIRVHKHIPTGGGLAGGSSNAAITLLALHQLHSTHRNIIATQSKSPDTQLLDIAASLGSDVPYFLYGGLCYVTERGTEIYPLDIEFPYHILIVLPGIHVSTPWAYNQVSSRLFGKDAKTRSTTATPLNEILDAIANPKHMRKLLRNDFEQPVFEQYPLLATIKSALYSSGALYAQMSGSGSTMYGIFETEELAQRAAQTLHTLPTYICHSTTRKYIEQ